MLKQLIQSYKNLPIAFGKMGVAMFIVSSFFIAKEYTGHLVNDYNFPFSWLFICLKIIINYALWLVLAPWIESISKKIYIRRKSLTQWIGIVGSILILSLFHRALATKLYDVTYYADTGYMKEFFGPNGIVALAVGSFSSLIELLVIIAVFVAADYQRQYLKNQQALINAQISTLQMQLHPHFLFNTLHSISSMIDIDTGKAQKMLTKVGALLRNLLENEMEQMTTIENEMEFIQHYLDLEQIRYSDKMHIEYLVPEEVLNAEIPNMLLQPLIENAIKYGMVPSTKVGKITIKIEKLKTTTKGEETVMIQISNTLDEGRGPILEKGTGLGLKNIKKRLEGIYGGLFKFEFGHTNKGLYMATISLPFKMV
ncbi:hypothetical protein DKG77_00780 [Flagellimonas aquimarina]|uniref:Signal transduction histidine kinase internal region domain-containing protein n=1 Tax=Flagellimonas aquimarina TaxID=2201895 RepID=A0A316L0I6_9FLAO|nr:histidine kinase [Allomuricauda koreensis]PWL39406.1 hypothetical protein DKG77_00780 [Allomuricauda koreensis]